MTKNFLSIIGMFLCLQINAQTFEWAKQLGGTGADIGKSITTDAHGNTYVTGTFSGTVDFDPGPGTTYFNSNGSYDIYVLKLNPNGDLIWVKQIGGSSLDQANKLIIDKKGNVCVTGFFFNTVDFDPGVGVENFFSATGSDGFVLILDSLGNFKKACQISGTGQVYPYGIDDDSFGNYYICGYVIGTTDFNPGIGVDTLTSDLEDCFILKLDSVLSYQWVKLIGGIGADNAQCIEVSASGNIYLTGTFENTVDFDAGSGITQLTSFGGSDIYCLKINSFGNLIWVKQIRGNSNDETPKLSIDNQQSVYVSGMFYNSVEFDTGSGTLVFNSNGNQDIFLYKIDSSGNYKWAKHIGGSEQDRCFSIFADDSGSLFSVGGYRGTVDFDPGVGTAQLTSFSLSNDEGYILKLDTSGNYLNAFQLVGTSASNCFSVTADNSGNIFTTGLFYGMVDFNPGSGITNLNSNGVSDVFIMKQASCLNTYSTINASACGSYICPSGHNVWYFTGTYLDTLFNYNGCDSIITINLTVKTFVWPGDVNNDSTVNADDLLALGLSYNETGFPRDSISNIWIGQCSQDWTGIQSNGKNMKYADCNGDGTVSFIDTVAINQNFSMSHMKLIGTHKTGADIFVVPSDNIVLPGQDIYFDINVGTTSAPVSDLYGLSFLLNTEPSSISTGTLNLSFYNSWLGAYGVNTMKLNKEDESSGDVVGAITGIDFIGRNGFGTVARLFYTINPAVASLDTITVILSNITANDPNGNEIILNPISTSFVIDPFVGIEHLDDNHLLSIYPNPSSGSFTLELGESASVEIYNAVGSIVYSGRFERGKHSISLDQAKGIYLIKATNGSISRNVRMVIQ